MKIYGLIGYPLTHSFSPAYFNNKFSKEEIQARYELYPLKHLKEVMTLLDENPEIKGLNVTIPYKEQIISCLDELKGAAAEIQAVNTISIKRNSSLYITGYNTDVVGFEASLFSFLREKQKVKALVLGTGGASKSVQYVLQKNHVSYRTVSRTVKKNTLTYQDLDEAVISNTLLIINTTPMGMSPHENNFPDIPYHALSPKHYCYDLVYNPEKTLFLSKAQEQGASIKNGLEMLEIQAEASWRIWNMAPE